MFYNEEVKIQFINDYKRSRIVAETSLTGMFNKTYKYEQQKGKDCHSFSRKEILAMYKGFDAKSVHVLENYNVYLKSYSIFCMHHGLCKTNNYADINKAMLLKCLDTEILNQKFLTREQLDDIEDELYNYTDKALLELLWEGISGKSMEDIVALNRSMISEDKEYICFNDGRKVKMSQKLYNYLDKAFSEKEYMCYGTTVRVKKLIGDDCLYKEMDNAYTVDSDDKFFRWVYRRVQTYRKHVDMPLLTMKALAASGLLYKIKNAMEKNSLGLREFLYTEEGKALAQQYGYKLNSYVDVIANKFIDFV